ncbi:hypothetical protein F3087_16230 [Nocardia colli]|uniref:Uncharacterized protein n=1 Tax=Nocardia colli TaxID=2545717 RepID=A0A5N0EKJ5_9NOCA|nr:hypothetical protein [Nocardia colli]KAA8888545.1 hypothetical protein F3087_16230 [Nocardia colli]
MDVDRVDVVSLLDSLCVDHGFCLPPDERNRFCTSPPSDVDSFTDAVFVAEGMDPHGDKHLRALVRQKVIRAFPGQES